MRLKGFMKKKIKKSQTCKISLLIVHRPYNTAKDLLKDRNQVDGGDSETLGALGNLGVTSRRHRRRQRHHEQPRHAHLGRKRGVLT